MKLTSTKHYNYIQDSLQGLFFINIPIKGIYTSIMGVLCYITGAEAHILEIIGMLLLADLLMGVLVAIKYKTLSSDFLVGIMYRAAMYLLLLMGTNWFVEICPYLSFIREIMYFFIASTELISILENADLLGFKAAKRIIDVINKNVENKLIKK